jgi:hypothetical protein
MASLTKWWHVKKMPVTEPVASLGLLKQKTSVLTKNANQILKFLVEDEEPVKVKSKKDKKQPKPQIKKHVKHTILINCSPANYRKVVPHMKKKHEKEQNLMDSDGKVNMEILKYDLDELFESPPIFAEPVMRFQDALLDPD